MTRWTVADVRRVQERSPAIQKPSKYRNQKTTVDGITFDSKKEAARYHELMLLAKAGQVKDIALQVPFGLNAGNDRRVTIGAWIADFVYQERVEGDWVARVEDVKGFRTPLYRWKKRHFEAQYGIQIRET